MADDIIEGSGNVFADLGLPDAAERQMKTRLAMAVNSIVKERRIKQTWTDAVLNIPQPKVNLRPHPDPAVTGAGLAAARAAAASGSG
jgi:predicted XRE-type DNA-binding protein